MTSITILLDECLREFVERQARIGGYASVGEYVATLVREAQSRQDEHPWDEERLKMLLREGLESGEPVEMTTEDWTAIREEVARRVADGQRV
jgi:antitoxin ParD1/3/4